MRRADLADLIAFVAIAIILASGRRHRGST